MEKVKSFSLDHTTMDVGIYNHGENNSITTYDIRLCKPNTMYIKPEASHTLEHYLATYLRNIFKDKIVYVGPMGCLTGFYILVRDVKYDDLVTGLIGVHKYINSTEIIPGNDELSCGNFKFHDYEEALKIYNEFYENYLKSHEVKLYENMLKFGLIGGK